MSFLSYGVPISAEQWSEEQVSLASFDLNGDGIDDFAQSVTANEAYALGYGWSAFLAVIFGVESGTVATIDEIDGTNGFIIGGPWVPTKDGPSYINFSAVPDASGDGIPDLLLNATAENDGMQSFSTRTVSHLLFGGATLARADAADGASDGRITVLNAAYLDDAGETYTALDDGPVFGGAGNDRVEGLSSALNAQTAGGDDVVVSGHEDDAIDLGPGADRTLTRGGNDTVSGREGDDVIKSGDGDDEIDGGSGDDIVLAGRGHDLVRGGGGAGGDDTVKAGEGDDVVFGQDGNDRLGGWRGTDILDGGEGDDVLLGQIGDDLLIGGPGRDRLVGGPGRDVFLVDIDSGEDRILDFRPGSDLIAIEAAPGVRSVADLDIRTVGSMVSIKFGDAGAQIIVAASSTGMSAGALSNALKAGGLRMVTVGVGEATSDTAFLGDGADIYMAGQGNDGVKGGGGDDLLYGGVGKDRLYGDDGDDRLYGNGGESDLLEGGAGDDFLVGAEGRDKLVGGTGDDTLDGAEGADSLDGGAGGDVLEGGTGDDVIDGGAGADLFVFRPGFGNDNSADDVPFDEGPPEFEIGADRLRFIGFEGETPTTTYADDLVRARTIVELETEAGDSIRFTLGFAERLGAGDLELL